MMRFKGRRLMDVRKTPTRCWFWVSGFSFSRATLLHDVPYDPHLQFLFFGEETSMTIRIFTHGYDFYCPSVNVCYHLWTRKYRPVFREIKLPNAEETRLERLAHLRLRLQLRMPCADASVDDKQEALRDAQLYGLGTVRSLAEYAVASGVDVAHHTAAPMAFTGGLEPSDFVDERVNHVMQLLLQQQLQLQQRQLEQRQHEQKELPQQQRQDVAAPPSAPSLEDVLRAIGMHDALSVFVYGSRVYGTIDEKSDWDFVVVVEVSPFPPDEPTQKLAGMDVSVYSAAAWRQMLRIQGECVYAREWTRCVTCRAELMWICADMTALECLWLPARCVLLSRVDWLAEWRFDAAALRRYVSNLAGNSWVKCNKKVRSPSLLCSLVS